MKIKNRLNLLWLICDQLRYHSLSSSGDPNINTPNIDRLAAGGVRFTHAISHCPVCIPFRAGLITGQYNHSNGVKLHGDLLEPCYRTIAHAFRKVGYRTSWVGKWHLGGAHGIHKLTGKWSGEDYWVDPKLRGGFEDWFGFNISNHYYKTFYSHGDEIKPYRLEGYQTDALADRSIQYLSETATKLKQPWFHCVSFEAPHPGLDMNDLSRNPAPPKYEAMFKPEEIKLRDNVPEGDRNKAREMLTGYYAQIANLDHNVGRILDWLEENDQAKNTLVVFFSDHGEMGGSHGRFHKEIFYDEAIRIPLIIRLPEKIIAGNRYEGIVSGIDIFPTCAGLCKIPIPSEVQGIDHSANLLGMEGAVRNEALIQWYGTRFGYANNPFRAIRTRRYTYCVGKDKDFCHLYDNDQDPFQLKNLFRENNILSIQKDLHERLCAAINHSGELIPEFIKLNTFI